MTRNYLDEVCANCGLTFSAHHGGSHTWPYNYCPGHQGKMDWSDGPGTIFSPTGFYEEIGVGTPANENKEKGEEG